MASNDVAGTSSSGSEVNHMHNTNNGAGVKVMVEQQTQSISGNLSSDSKMETPSGRESMNQVNVNIVPQELSRYRNGSTGGTMDFSHDVPSNSSAEAQHLCKICNVTFTSLDTLTMHHLVHTMNKETMGDDMISDMEQSKLEEVGGAFSHPGNSSHLPEMLNHERYPHLYCDICNLGFKEFLDFQSHQETVHEYRKPFECLFCRESFSSGAELQEHSKVHKGSKPFQCDICNREFADLSKLRGHEKLHAAGKFYPCSVCPKSFRNKVRLKQHEQSHSKVCILCKESFDDFESLREHAKDIHGMGEPTRFKDAESIAPGGYNLNGGQIESLDNGMHTEVLEQMKHSFTKLEQKLPCSECGNIYKDLRTLRTHQEEDHHFRKNFECNFCSDSFPDLSLLKAHMSVHKETGKPFECDICNKKFSEMYRLREHEKIHSGKTYYCTVCSKSFKRKDHLKKHSFRHLVGRKNPCVLCNEVFENLQDLKKHDEEVHGGTGSTKVCNICGKVFKYGYQLRDHMFQHTGECPYKCPVCSKTYANKYSLKAHQLLHTGNLPFKCTQCPKAYNDRYKLKVHALRHTGEKSYKCSKCPRAFWDVYKLREHLRHHDSPKKRFTCPICNKQLLAKNNFDKHVANHKETQKHKCNLCDESFQTLSTLQVHQWIIHDEMHVIAYFVGNVHM